MPMPDEHNTRDDAESAESANQIFARELCDAAVLHAAKFARAEMLMHWRVNRALRERLVAELDARDAALRDAREQIERLRERKAASLVMETSLHTAYAEIDRLNEHSAAKDAVVAARKLWKIYGTGLSSMREYESWAKEFGDAQLDFEDALARLDAAPREESDS
jgi:hypothetical protein